VSLNNVGFLLRAIGEPDEALAYFQQAKEMCEKLYPESQYPSGHPGLAFSIYHLGLHYQEGNQREKALPLLERALAMYQRLGAQEAVSAPEAHALRFLHSFPPVLDDYLAATQGVPAEV